MSFRQSRRHGCSSACLMSVMGSHLRPRNIVYCSSVSRHVGVFCRVYLGNNEMNGSMMNIGDSDRSCQSCMVMYRIGWIIICIQLVFIYTIIYIYLIHYFIYDFLLIFCNPWFISIIFRPIGWSTILIVQSLSRSWNAGRLQQQCRPQIRWVWILIASWWFMYLGFK